MQLLAEGLADLKSHISDLKKYDPESNNQDPGFTLPVQNYDNEGRLSF